MMNFRRLAGYVLVLTMGLGVVVLAQAPRPPVYYLRDLLDVGLASPSTGQVLTFNSVTGKWENKPATGAPGGSSGMVQWNNAGAFDGVVTAKVVGGALQLSAGNTIFYDQSNPTHTFVLDASNVAAGQATVVVPNASNPVIVAPDPGAANNFLTGITGLGVITKAQPTISNLANLSGTSKLIGSGSASSAVSEITLGTNLSMSGTTLNATAGGGGVTTFQTGNLSPLFTAAPSSATSGAVSQTFTLSTAAANTVFGNNTASTAAPVFSSAPRFTSIGNLTSNGFVTTSGGTGTLGVDTTAYTPTTRTLTIAGIANDLSANRTWTQDNITGLSSTGIIKRTGANTLGIAVAGTDYVAAPATPLTSVQFNNSSALGGSANFEWDNSNNILQLGGNVGIKSNAAGILEVNNLTSGQWGGLKVGTFDAGTANAAVGLTIGHKTSSAPATGLGAALQFTGNDTTTADVNIGQIQAWWQNATHNTNVANFSFLLPAGNLTQIDAADIKATSSGGAYFNIATGYQVAGGAGTGTFLLGDGTKYSQSGWTVPFVIGSNTFVLTSNGTNAVWAAPSGGGGTPGGSTTQLQYNNAGAFGGISSATFDGTIPITLTLTPAANTYATGLLLTDTTVAGSSGNQQYSPSLILHGSGWKTTATAGPQNVDWRLTNIPVQNTVNPTTSLEFAGSVNNAAYRAIAKFNRNDITVDSAQLPDGSAAAPGHSFIGDATMGMYRNATAISFASAGSQIADIASSQLWTLGNVGIGNTVAAPNVVLRPSAGLSVTTSVAANYTPIVTGNTATGNTTGTGLTLNIDNTVGAGGTGLGVGMKFQAETDTTNDTEIGQILGVWGTGTHASRTGYMDFQLVNNAAADASKMRLFGSGGLSVNNTTDPGAGVISANSGYWVGTAASTSGKILKSDGTKFVASTETYAAPGTSGNVLTSDGTNWTSAAPTGGGGAPGGSNTQLQYNNSGAFGGIATATYNNSTGALTLASGGTNQNLTLSPSGTGTLILSSANSSVLRNIIGLTQSLATGTISSQIEWRNNAGAQQWAFGNDSSANGTKDFYMYDGIQAMSRIYFDTGNRNITGSGGMWAWGSSNGLSPVPDTALARTSSAVVEVNNGTAGSLGTLKAATLNATTGFQINGVNQAWELSNGNTSAQSSTFASDTYVTGSNITVGANNWKAGGVYHFTCDLTKTAAGTAAMTLNVRAGTGVVGDTSLAQITYPAGTAAVDVGLIDLTLVIRTIGSSGTGGVKVLSTHNGTSAGLWNTGSIATVISATSASSFNTTTATTIGVSINGGTSFSGTIQATNATYNQ